MFGINLAQYKGIKVRPNADPAPWLMFLLPTALIISVLNHWQESSQIYKFNACLSVGLIGTSAIFILQCWRCKNLVINRSLHLIPAAVTATLFQFLFNSGLLFSLGSGLVASIFYWKLMNLIFQKFPHSFTLGELSVVAQGLTLFLYSSTINLFMSITRTPIKVLDISTIIIQVGLCAIGFIIILTHYLCSLRKPIAFYLVSIFIILLFIVALLHVILQQSALFWIFNFLFENFSRTKMVFYWIICSLGCVIVVNQQIKGATKATPVVRKIFHLFAVAVFLPGLIYQCSLIYLASGIVLGIFIMLEILRILYIPPFGESLQNGFTIYKDQKDTGHVALTAIYLLVGCALPVWIHPAPCDILDSAGFNLVPVMSGILSTGIGDTAASIIGSNFGRHFWPGTQKTMEGTLGCILSQIAVVYILINLGFIIVNDYQMMKTIVAIVAASLVEASTTQIDNIVLPLVLFIILC